MNATSNFNACLRKKSVIRDKALRLRQVRKTLKLMIPKATLYDFQKIMEIAEGSHLRHLPSPILAWRSVTTHIRHNHTEYDALLEEGYDVESAKHYVLEAMNETLEIWGATKKITTDEIEEKTG